MEAIGILYSAEVRWFIEGFLPQSVLDWFLDGRHDDPQSRVDRYLLFPGCESVGVKEREGRFEIKARWSLAEIACFAGKAIGRCEGWAKWSYDRPPVARWLEALSVEPEGWIEVEKTRRLLQFSLDEGVSKQVEPNVQPGEGCTIELTVVRAPASCWWTVGLEAFGTRNRLRTNLLTVAESFFARHEPPFPFRVTSSCSYPAWLNGFASVGGCDAIPHPEIGDRIRDDP